MKRRLLSLFLAFVTILSLLPTAAFAASSEEDALGEVDIYNGDYELGYLAINGAVKKQMSTSTTSQRAAATTCENWRTRGMCRTQS